MKIGVCAGLSMCGFSDHVRLAVNMPLVCVSVPIHVSDLLHLLCDGALLSLFLAPFGIGYCGGSGVAVLNPGLGRFEFATPCNYHGGGLCFGKQWDCLSTIRGDPRISFWGMSALSSC